VPILPPPETPKSEADVWRAWLKPVKGWGLACLIAGVAYLTAATNLVRVVTIEKSEPAGTPRLESYSWVVDVSIDAQNVTLSWPMSRVKDGTLQSYEVRLSAQQAGDQVNLPKVTTLDPSGRETVTFARGILMQDTLYSMRLVVTLLDSQAHSTYVRELSTTAFIRLP